MDNCAELKPAQKLVFETWNAGFTAQELGWPISSCPNHSHWAHAVRKVWEEGWRAGAAVDRIAEELLPPHRKNKPLCHTQLEN